MTLICYVAKVDSRAGTFTLQFVHSEVSVLFPYRNQFGVINKKKKSKGFDFT